MANTITKEEYVKQVQKAHKEIALNYELIKLASTTNNGNKIGVVHLHTKG